MLKFDREKVFEIRCKAKQGIAMAYEEQQFCCDMYNFYPIEYSAMTKEVFDATKPV